MLSEGSSPQGLAVATPASRPAPAVTVVKLRALPSVARPHESGQRRARRQDHRRGPLRPPQDVQEPAEDSGQQADADESLLGGLLERGGVRLAVGQQRLADRGAELPEAAGAHAEARIGLGLAQCVLPQKDPVLRELPLQGSGEPRGQCALQQSQAESGHQARHDAETGEAETPVMPHPHRGEGAQQHSRARGDPGDRPDDGGGRDRAARQQEQGRAHGRPPRRPGRTARRPGGQRQQRGRRAGAAEGRAGVGRGHRVGGREREPESRDGRRAGRCHGQQRAGDPAARIARRHGEHRQEHALGPARAGGRGDQRPGGARPQREDARRVGDIAPLVLRRRTGRRRHPRGPHHPVAPRL